MDVHELATHYNLSVKKMRRMQRDGVLHVGKPTIPPFWRKTLQGMRKGNMTALSVALAYKFPDTLSEISDLYSVTPNDRRILSEHFKKSGLPGGYIPSENLCTPMFGASINETIMVTKIICEIQNTIPNEPVDYLYLAVRLLLSCPNEHNMQMMAQSMPRGLTVARSHEKMRGWWHTEARPNGKNAITYHRPGMPHDL